MPIPVQGYIHGSLFLFQWVYLSETYLTPILQGGTVLVTEEPDYGVDGTLDLLLPLNVLRLSGITVWRFQVFICHRLSKRTKVSTLEVCELFLVVVFYFLLLSYSCFYLLRSGIISDYTLQGVLRRRKNQSRALRIVGFFIPRTIMTTPGLSLRFNCLFARCTDLKLIFSVLVHDKLVNYLIMICDVCKHKKLKYACSAWDYLR